MHVIYHGLQWSGDTIGDVFFVRIQAIQDTAKKCQAFNHFSDGGEAMFLPLNSGPKMAPIIYVSSSHRLVTDRVPDHMEAG